MTEQVHGVQPVLEALAHPDRIDTILLARDRGAATRKIEQAARAAGVRIKKVPKEALDRLAGPGARHQGAIAELSGESIRALELDAVLEPLEGREDAMVVLLDGIQDPGNLGAILRSAHALGASAAILPRDRCAPLNATVVKASAGAALHLPVAQITNLKHALEPLRERGFWTAAAVMGGDPAPRVDLSGRLALVIGSEGKGVRPTLARQCDHQVAIPMSGDFESLNASVAAGILLYEASRQRNFEPSTKSVDRSGGSA